MFHLGNWRGGWICVDKKAKHKNKIIPACYYKSLRTEEKKKKS